MAEPTVTATLAGEENAVTLWSEHKLVHDLNLFFFFFFFWGGGGAFFIFQHCELCCCCCLC